MCNSNPHFQNGRLKPARSGRRLSDPFAKISPLALNLRDWRSFRRRVLLLYPSFLDASKSYRTVWNPAATLCGCLLLLIRCEIPTCVPDDKVLAFAREPLFGRRRGRSKKLHPKGIYASAMPGAFPNERQAKCPPARCRSPAEPVLSDLKKCAQFVNDCGIVCIQRPTYLLGPK
jgi:hypothetical protein